MKLIRLKLLFTFLFLALPVPVSLAASFDINHHDDITRFTYATYSGQRVIADGGMLYIEKRETHENVFHLGINKVAENIRFGVRGVYASPGENDVLTIAGALKIRFFPAKDLRFDIGAYYAPEFTSMMDASGYTELGFRLSFNITSPLDLYLGYRNIKIKLSDAQSKVEIDDDLHLGLQFYF